MRVGVLRNAKHQPAADKSAGLTSVLSGPARKTQKGLNAEINTELKRLRMEAAKTRKRSALTRKTAKAIKGQGFKKVSKFTSKIAKGQTAKAKAITARARALRARKTKVPKGYISIRDVLKSAQKATGIDFIRKPFQAQNSPAFKKFLASYLKAASNNKSMSQTQKLLLRVVLDPILKSQYGRNSAATEDRKGFNRRFIDTGQMVRAITSDIKPRRRKNV